MDWRRLPYGLYDFLEFIVGIFAVVASVLTVVRGGFNSNPNTFAVAAILGILVMSLIKILKLKKVTRKRASHMAKSNHKAAHRLRNELFRLETLPAKKRSDYDYLFEKLQGIAAATANDISGALTASVGEPVTVCIKYFATPLNNVIDFDEVYLCVLCRSNNTDLERAGRLRYKLTDNTDFFQIVSQDQSFFAASNLTKKSKMLKKATGKPYLSSATEWSKYYRSRIVVPIRMERKLKGIASEGYEYLGFICADAPSAEAFRQNEISYHVDYLKTFADQLYIYFEKFTLTTALQLRETVPTEIAKQRS